MSKKILIVDDEKNIVEILKFNLTKEGFSTIEAYDGEEGLQKALNQNPDLIILDIMLPKMDGFTVCKKIRQTLSTPIEMLTAKEEEMDKVLGLELGADDYVTKPFSLRELAARVRAVLRRAGKGIEDQKDILKVGDITIDADGHQVTVSGREVALTPTEFSILLFLAERPGRVASRLQLVNASLGEAYVGYERSIDTHVSNLRKKIEDDPAKPRQLQTVYGVGYKLVP